MEEYAWVTTVGVRWAKMEADHNARWAEMAKMDGPGYTHARRNNPMTSLMPKPPGWTYYTVINPPPPPEPPNLHCCGVADMIAAEEYGHWLESGYVADTSGNFSGDALAHSNSMPSRGFQSLGMYQSLIKLLKHESFLGLYKGNGAGVIRIVPFAAWYFMIIEQCESWILNKCLMLGLGPSINLVPLGNLFASCAIEFLSAVVKSMTRESEEGREAVGLLLDLFDFPAANLLDMLSSNTQNALHFAKAGSFRPLVQCLKEGYDMNKILIATTFSRWEFSDHNELTIADDGVIEPLVKMSINGKLNSKLSSLNAVQNASNVTEIVQGLIRSGSTGPLLQLLLSVTFVLMILKEFASIILARSVQADSILVNEDVAKQMLSLLNPSSPIIQGHLLEALNTLVVHPSASKVRREINSHSKAIGLAIMIVVMRPHINIMDKNTNTRVFSVVAYAFGIPALLPFLKPICQRNKSWQMFKMNRSLYNNMKGEGLVPHMFTYSIFLKAFCKSGKVVGAYQLCVQLSNEGCSPNDVSYTTIISYRCICGQVDKTKAPSLRFTLVGLVYNARIHGVCHEYRIKEAFNLVHVMVEKDVYPTKCGQLRDFY